MLTKQVAFDFKSPQVARVLVSQAAAGHVGMVRLLLEQHVSCDVDDHGFTPLMAGAKSGDPEIAEALLEAGAPVDQINDKKQTALLIASMNGQLAYARVLREHGAKLEMREERGKSALHAAVASGSTELVEYLIAQGSAVETRDQDNLSPLMTALANRSLGIAAILEAGGAKLDQSHPEFLDQMELAIAMDLASVMKSAIEGGWSINTKFRRFWPTLRVAEIYGSSKCVDVLRAVGAKDDLEGTPAIVSAREVDAPPRPVGVVMPQDPRSIYEVYPRSVVELEILIDPEGAVQFPRTRAQPNPRLALSTLAAVRKWKFTLPKKNGILVALKVTLPLEFPSSSDRVIGVTETDVAPVVIKKAQPIYPKEALVKKPAGPVWVRFVINTEGHTEFVQLFESPDPSLNAPAIKAVEQWVYKPAQRGGKPVSVRLEAPIYFLVR